MIEREITDQDGNSWNFVQAYSGGEGDHSEKVARLTKGENIPVVCTPSGGAQSIRLQLPRDWKENLSDQELLEAMQKGQSKKSK
jgi:hypothetical protein